MDELGIEDQHKVFHYITESLNLIAVESKKLETDRSKKSDSSLDREEVKAPDLS